MSSITHFIETNRNKIVNRWIACPSLIPIVSKLELEIEEYKEQIARPVLEFFITILIGKNQRGDCPVMRQVVETFHSRGLAVEDVFLNCTGLKNAIVELCMDRQIDVNDFSEVITILDQNLYKILSIYTNKILEHERNLNQYSKIINEHVLLSVTDTEGKITYASDAFCELTGYSKNEILHQSHSLIRHSDMKKDFFQKMWGQILSGNVWKGKMINKKKDGGSFIAKTEIIPILDDFGRVVEFLAIRNDITDKELSQYDSLTHLYNRRTFERHFDLYMTKKGDLSLMMLDIDYFKKINDTFGHSTGDSVIKSFAEILRNTLRDDDICARWGGEEFLVLLPNTKLLSACKIAERIRKSLEEAVLIDAEIASSEATAITCSIGVTQRKSKDVQTNMFERVDAMLYEAKKNGRNQTICDLDKRIAS